MTNGRVPRACLNSRRIKHYVPKEERWQRAEWWRNSRGPSFVSLCCCPRLTCLKFGSFPNSFPSFWSCWALAILDSLPTENEKGRFLMQECSSQVKNASLLLLTKEMAEMMFASKGSGFGSVVHHWSSSMIRLFRVPLGVAFIGTQQPPCRQPLRTQRLLRRKTKQRQWKTGQLYRW